MPKGAGGAIGIKVAVRCRPYTCDDALGVYMVQNGDEDGEIRLLNSSYTKTRFGFSWSWWSAYGWQRHIKPADGKTEYDAEADEMKLTNQMDCYEACGKKIKAELYGGSAVVMFAYGLSGSGKTFTVFGPDAVDIPEAWFKHNEPHDLWGIFPRLGCELFQDKKDDWKITMKYFQNVVNTVRDLMSPVGREESYKKDFVKDKDGFMDIKWCTAKVLTSWAEMRETFMSANARKAIAPTQFNHQSTRGHCIMVIEVEKPNEKMAGQKNKGRLYVCDLAGTEPAGDVVYAKYKKKVFPDGTIEQKFIGAHEDKSKTKELQDQGKKINLSLSEMAQFFLKMAQAIKKKKLKPGQTIPGCNSYFLCKYLKGTMLQARTYLFCAIRPEVKYLNYTYSTLGFAKNASVIKLKPKKATTKTSKAEAKLMKELEAMKEMMEQLAAENEKLRKSGGGGAGGGEADKKADEQMKKMQMMLAAKQAQLMKAMMGQEEGKETDEERQLRQQKEDYARRGISLTHFALKECKSPYLINVDEDEFRSKRYMFVLDGKKPSLTVGPGADIQPFDLHVVRDHLKLESKKGKITCVGGKGEVYVNGKEVKEGKKQALKTFDRVCIGHTMMVFVDPSKPGKGAEPTPFEIAEELRDAMRKNNAGENAAFQEQMKKFAEEKEKFEKLKAEAKAAGKELSEQQIKSQEAWEACAREMKILLPQLSEMRDVVRALNRTMLDFKVALQRSEDGGSVTVKVKVQNKDTNATTFLDTFEFTKSLQILKDEIMWIKNALANGRDYEADDNHDPIKLLFDTSFHLGNARIYLLQLAHLLETEEDDDFYVDIRNAVSPYNCVGKLAIKWKILSDPEDEENVDWDKIPEVESPEELMGHPWCYMIEITEARGLPIQTDLTYCQYEFFGEQFTTESIEPPTEQARNPQYNYTFVHYMPSVTKDFLNYLEHKSLSVSVYVNPYILNPPKDKISTKNPVIAAALGSGEEGPAVQLPKGEKQLREFAAELAKENHRLRQQLARLTAGK